MEKMKPLPDQKKMIGNYYEIYGFTPEEKFHVIAGIHTSPMIEGDENGDSFSMGKVRERSFVSMISDGMGTGQEAKKRRGNHSSIYDASEPLITYRENSNLS